MIWAWVFVAFWLGVIGLGIFTGWRIARFNRDHPFGGDDDA